ncbi:pectinesterase family protein [Massilia horti]|uniref:Pectinesterase catalytic domain-containing protein n=1 Tax=Massilia horti TaxID=2562153 RepID=A0A4Y9T5V3_9BURK|nr:pectinesterase family protein [Massilia horti]TFW32648.1 hypothetical protein E4O92_09225 [Massilia horti]
MKPKKILALLGTALSLYASAATAATCPGNAIWCEDFEHGPSRWSAEHGTPVLQAQSGTNNHVLLLPGDGRPVLLQDATAVPKDTYYVEARMRPAAGNAATEQQGYLIARYLDERNWLGFGLNVAPGNRQLGLDIVRMQDGQLKRLKRTSADIDALESFYTLRLDVVGNALTLYLNGNRIVGTDESSLPPGRIGAIAIGANFELDDLRIGDAKAAPGRIGLANMNNRLSLQAGDGAQRYQVRAMTKGGGGIARFAAASSAPSVVGVAMDGDMLVVTPRAPGNATITVSSVEDNNVAVSIGASVGPAFAVSGQAYALQDRTQPAVRARDVQVDTPLQLRFDSQPNLGASGSIRIHRASDNALVDVIRAGNEVNQIGTTPDGFKRVVRYNPIEVSGATVTIRPHDARLAYDTEYYVMVDANLFAGATIGGTPFSGIGKRAGWTFRTRAHMPAGRDITVGGTSAADFRTVQGALNHVMRNVPRKDAVTIRVANGSYGDLLYLRGKDNVTLRGESRDGAVITVENGNGLNPGAGGGQGESAPGSGGGRSVFLIEDADMVWLDNISIVSTGWRSKPTGGQAETLYFNSDGRFVATNSNFISEQDTILVRGWSWFYHSLIAGNVDFIWGYNHAALFEESEIRSLGDSTDPAKGGYIVQARTLSRDDPGFVFLNSRITHGPGPAGNDVPRGSSFLARPGSAWDNVSYINCRMDEHISPKGWNGRPRDGIGWYELNSMDMNGKPLDLSARVNGQVLGAEQAARFASRARVFAGFDNGKGWMPALDAAK